jgi:hypothetical protein
MAETSHALVPRLASQERRPTPGRSERGQCTLRLQLQTSQTNSSTSVECQGTKSLRSSPLRGGKSRETGSQLRGQRWRV